MAIGTSHESIPASVSFPFGAGSSIFGINDTERCHDDSGWPAIWGVVERAGIHGGCGNSDQAQADVSGLIEGVYHLRDGAWKKIEAGE